MGIDNKQEIQEIKSIEDLNKLGFKEKLEALRNAIKSAKEADSTTAKEKAKVAYKTFYEIFSPEKQNKKSVVFSVEGKRYTLSSDVLIEQIEEIGKLQQDVDALLDQKTQQEILKQLDLTNKETDELKKDVVTASDKKENTASTETLTEEQKKAEIQKVIAEMMASGGLKVERNIGGLAPYKINVTKNQIECFRKLYNLQYINDAVFAAQDGTIKKTRLDRKIDKNVAKALDLEAKGDLKGAINAMTAAQKATAEKKLQSAQLAKLSTEVANDIERMQYNLGIAGAATEMARQSKLDGYHGSSFMIDQFHPAFVNICRNLCTSSPNYGGVIDIGNGQKAVLQCPEMEREFNDYANNTFGHFSPETYTSCPNEYRESWIGKLLGNTNMTDQQKRNADKLITTGGIGVGLFFLGKWLFTGKSPDGSKAEKGPGFWGRLGITAGSLIGLNLVSQMGTGHNAMDIVKGLWYGDVKFEDLWNGRFSKEKNFGARFDLTSACLRDVPMGALRGCCERTATGGVKINLPLLENYVNNRLALAKTDTEKALLGQQLKAIESFKNDPQGEQKLQQVLAEMGIDYNYITSANDTLTLNEKFNATSKRQVALKEYMDTQGLDYAMTNPVLDTEIGSYIATGKPTIEELAKKGKFTTKSAEKQASDVEVKDDALQNIDSKYAKELQLAINKTSDIDFSENKGARPHFEIVDGHLTVASYGFNTPLWIDADGKYRIAGSDYSTVFSNAEAAVRSANLLNFIVVTYKGSAKTDNPFEYTLGDLKKTDKPLPKRRECFDKTFVGASIKKLLGVAVVDGDDYTLFPWKSSTLKKIGSEELGSDAGRTELARYLNSLKKTDGKSIWAIGDNTIQHGRDIEGWYGNTNIFPEKKTDTTPNNRTDTTNGHNTTSNEVVGGTTAGVAAGATAETHTNSSQESHDRVENNGYKAKEEVEKEGISEADKVLGDRWYELYQHKDGGNKNGSDRLERDKEFFYLWAHAYHTHQQEFTVDVVNTTGEKRGLVYRRQKGQQAPRRISEGGPWGYEKTVEQKENSATTAKTTVPEKQVEIKDINSYVTSINGYLHTDSTVAKILKDNGYGTGFNTASNIHVKLLKNNILGVYKTTVSGQSANDSLLGSLSPDEYILKENEVNRSKILQKIDTLFKLQKKIQELTLQMKKKEYSYSELFGKGVTTKKGIVLSDSNVHIMNIFGPNNKISLKNVRAGDNHTLYMDIPGVQEEYSIWIKPDIAIESVNENLIKNTIIEKIKRVVDERTYGKTVGVSASR